MLRGKGTKSVVDVLKPILAKQGIPEELVADNNPFGSKEMRRFAKDCDLKITTSSPHYLQSNGETEHFVNNVKTILKKKRIRQIQTWPCSHTGTAQKGQQFSPTLLLMNRQLTDLTTQISTAQVNEKALQQMLEQNKGVL
ncbi:hypothetical protein RRG08_007516 [Elysia crispata]|uniref:Integrase catalytic domain-containing protein n=1 Tax=Elysia crispata TaxID=231223 RepID=A0AAE1DPS9_9GAST|nr:hypothetical protein RRG08_007516 [Elysia crispata]